MKRTTVMIPEDLKTRAERRARRTGSSLGALVRESLEAALREPVAAAEDPLFADRAVFRGSLPKDLAAEHDTYLYGDEP
jgi:predicted DNA-binding protein